MQRFSYGNPDRRGNGQKYAETGAGDGGRTRDIDLGKVALYH